MTKQDFLELAGRLYDELAEPKLFRETEETVTESIPAVREIPVITNYKPRRGSNDPLRLDNLSYHYKRKLRELVDICQECGVSVTFDSSYRYINRSDVPYLTAYIERKYNNFNEA